VQRVAAEGDLDLVMSQRWMRAPLARLARPV
jgi:hypothetical protein